MTKRKDDGLLRRFKRYPTYKDSGVAWLGEIPQHWGVVRSKRLFRLRNVRAHRSERQLTASQQHGIIPQEEFISREGRRVVQVVTGGDILKHVEVNDFVISMRSFQGGIEWARVSGAVSSAYVVLAPSAAIEYPFYAWLFKSTRYVEALQSTSNLVRDGQALRFENFAQVDLPVIPPAEQRRIARFLDVEIARIDALLTAKARLLTLLSEERSALITRAVTTGREPKAAMTRAADVFHTIPAHWSVSRLKYASTKIGSGKTPTGGAEVYTTTGVMLLRSQNVHFDGLRLDDVAFIDEKTDAEMAGSRVQEGDVLLNMTGASLGRCCVAQLNGARANVNQHVCVIRPRRSQFEPAFLAAVLGSDPLQAQVFASENGISRDALNFDQIGRLLVLQPPLNEQRDIVSYVSDVTKRIDSVIAKLRTAISRIRELRAAVVSAAVTGKIDVDEELA